MDAKSFTQDVNPPIAIADMLLRAVLAASIPCWTATADTGPDTPTLIREGLTAGTTTQVRVELKADGLYRPGLPPGDSGTEAKMPKPLSLEVSTRLTYRERVLVIDPPARENPAVGKPGTGRARKVVRLVGQAASAINGEVRTHATSLRPELRLLLAERRKSDGQVDVVSTGGPLSRSELELVQGLGESLNLGDLLPEKPLSRGHSYKIAIGALPALTGYDSIKSSTLEGVLESLDDALARIRLRGDVTGSVLGGPGTIKCTGLLTFDRNMGLVDHLELDRSEERQAGPVEAGLDVKSTMTLIRRPISLPAELADEALAGLPAEISPRNLLLELSPRDQKFTLLHDRRWHLYWDDTRLTILKRLDGGAVQAQCNLAKGPHAGKGRHQDLKLFREDIRRALGPRFGEFLGAGTVDGDPSGGFRYKVGVQGREGDLGLLWYYYLVVSPEGDQLLATFTLGDERAVDFGEQDVEMIGSLRWIDARTAKP